MQIEQVINADKAVQQVEQKAVTLTITKMESPSLATKFPMVKRVSVCGGECVNMITQKEAGNGEGSK